MKNLKFLFAFILMLAYTCSSFAQELKCTVVISTEQLKSTATGSSLDKAYVAEMQNAIMQFINSSSNKWTNDRFRENEKIICNIMINIKCNFHTRQMRKYNAHDLFLEPDTNRYCSIL
ncbi:MAG: hypothetical protein RL711_1087 [Bacteroidota bacterium]